MKISCNLLQAEWTLRSTTRNFRLINLTDRRYFENIWGFHNGFRALPSSSTLQVWNINNKMMNSFKLASNQWRLSRLLTNKVKQVARFSRKLKVFTIPFDFRCLRNFMVRQRVLQIMWIHPHFWRRRRRAKPWRPTWKELKNMICSWKPRSMSLKLASGI